ncbi:MAG: hypothetical protein LBV07_05200, partial [Syntrophobacterales bacterium]|nr:hypothetical protein [Syntrophobacterales bacterium]
FTGRTDVWGTGTTNGGDGRGRWFGESNAGPDPSNPNRANLAFFVQEEREIDVPNPDYIDDTTRTLTFSGGKELIRSIEEKISPDFRKP